MTETASRERAVGEGEERLSQTIVEQRSRLWRFIRKRVPDRLDAEDILQEVFYEFVESYRLLKPVEQVSAWLFRVARNRITDLFRKRKPVGLSEAAAAFGEGEETLTFEDLLPSPAAGPEAVFARGVLLDEPDEAIEELPEEQRSVFIAHELEGQSFKEIAAETGASINTLLSRKRYAVLHLRKRLEVIYAEFRGVKDKNHETE